MAREKHPPIKEGHPPRGPEWLLLRGDSQCHDGLGLTSR